MPNPLCLCSEGGRDENSLSIENSRLYSTENLDTIKFGYLLLDFKLLSLI